MINQYTSVFGVSNTINNFSTRRSGEPHTEPDVQLTLITACHSKNIIHHHFFPFPLSKLRFHDSNESQAFGCFSGDDVFCGDDDDDFAAFNDCFDGEVVTPVIIYIHTLARYFERTWETGGG